MVSPVVNVVRYSALVGGIGYGIVHRRTLQKREDARALVAEQKHQQHLKLQAQKEADAKILATVRGGGGSASGALDPDSPNFDMEKWLNSVLDK